MTELEKFNLGLEYDCTDPEIGEIQHVYRRKLWEYNQLGPDQNEEKQKYMHEVFAECGEDNFIESPFHANWGGHHVHFGNGIYANSGLTLVDDADIYVGSHTMFGPNVVVASAGHPIDPEKRKHSIEINKPVHIGENVWIGAGVIIIPGITIGDNSVIGAGSVVVKDIPANVVAVGNPCKVIHPIDKK